MRLDFQFVSPKEFIDIPRSRAAGHRVYGVHGIERGHPGAQVIVDVTVVHPGPGIVGDDIDHLEAGSSSTTSTRWPLSRPALPCQWGVWRSMGSARSS